MTLVELIFVISLLAYATVGIARFVTTTRKNMSRQEAGAELLQRSLRVLSNLRSGLQGCVEIIADYNDSGTANTMLPIRSLLVASVTQASSGAPGPVAFSRWPTVQTIDQVDMNGPSDAGATAWGNEIMYVAELNPVTFTAYYTPSGLNWSIIAANTLTTTIAEAVSVPRVQFVYDYLSWDTGTAVAGCGQGLRVTEWRSQPYIEYSGLSILSDAPGTYNSNTCCPRLQAACAYLSGAGYSAAFDPSGITESAGANCFYALAPESNISGATPEALPSFLPTGSWTYLDDFDLLASYSVKPGLNLGKISRSNGGAGGQISGASAYSVAFNVSGTSTTSTSVVALQAPGGLVGVPAYAPANYVDSDGLGGNGFPAGFEVAVDGPPNSREIVMRLALMASNQANTAPGTFQALTQTSEIAVGIQSDF